MREMVATGEIDFSVIEKGCDAGVAGACRTEAASERGFHLPPTGQPSAGPAEKLRPTRRIG
ncbi:hypothetical protein AB0I81_28285 [Nonomuraea sp. NPDC050404]|uniref:hypothetical protein n=1 Tax=Nonomuraea sp. NPDC050404 TaxID=3155783 RepID=UPI0033E8AFD9